MRPFPPDRRSRSACRRWTAEESDSTRELQLDLRPQLADAVARDAEVARGAACVAREHREEAFAPERHPGSLRGKQGLATEEERGLFRIDFEPALAQPLEHGRHLRVFRESVARRHAVELR